jgi:hypothetical protein
VAAIGSKPKMLDVTSLPRMGVLPPSSSRTVLLSRHRRLQAPDEQNVLFICWPASCCCAWRPN